AALGLLAGLSNVMFFGQALVPLAGALVVAGLLGRIAWAHTWWVLAITWPVASLGAFLNAYLFNVTSLAHQARFSVASAGRAAVVFWEGFSGQLRLGEPLHWLALGSLALFGVLAMRAQARAPHSTGSAAT